MSAHSSAGRRLALLGALTMLSMTACTDLPRTNPFDPEMPVNVIVSGTDTVTAINQDVAIAFEITPEWGDAPILWDYDPILTVTATAERSRTFRIPAHLWIRDTIRFTVSAGPHRGSRLVTLDQRLARVGFLPCPLIECVALLDANPILPRVIGLTHWDASDAAMLDLTTVSNGVALGVVSRDPSVVEINYAASGRDLVSLVPKAQGSTYIVSTQFGSDSVLVYSDWHPASMQMTCPDSMSVAESVELAAMPVSANGIPLFRPTAITWALDNSGTAAGDLTSGGVLTAATEGSLFITASGRGVFGSCLVTVSP